MTKRIKLRTLFIGGLMTLLFVVLIVRVYFVQVVHADFWYGEAKKNWAAYEKIQATRGTISDRDGDILAMDVAGYTVAVSPKIIHELGIENEVVSALHTVLGKPESELRDIVTKKNEKGEFFAQREVRNEGWKIGKELADQVKELREQLRDQAGQSDVGIYLLEQSKRYYPRNAMASHLVGYVNKEGEAKNGIELTLDDRLRGIDGEIKYERDGNRLQIDNGEVEYVPAEDGANVTLTIDLDIQYYIEKAIKEAYNEYKPKSITAIAADPRTMEILGMATLPNYNPNLYWETKPGADFDYAIKGLLEPGSTFKIVTLAAAVEEGVFDPEETYQSGSIRVADSTLRDIQRSGWGRITYLEGLKRSSNVAFVKLGYEKMDNSTLMNYINNFGFGQKTGIELQGELAGSVAARYPTEKATLTFGQGRVQVTPIQQLAAVAAVANGGKLLQPHLVKKIEDPMTKETVTFEPKLVRQVISEESARQVGEYLEQVVSDQEIGTGRGAYIEGYRVAGKTGTAQKVVGKGYSQDKFIVSFIGYAPVEDPRIAVYVVVDEPNNPYVGGGTVAAPVFREIVLQSLRQMGVGPSNADNPDEPRKEQLLTAPDVTELLLTQAKSELDARSLSYEVIGDGTKVLRQIPQKGAAISSSQRIYLVTEERSKLQTPNLQDLSLRDALEVCSLLELKCTAQGEGFVRTQTLAEAGGEQLLKLVLRPRGAADDEELAEEDGEAADGEAGSRDDDADGPDDGGPGDGEEEAGADEAGDGAAAE